MLVVVLEVPTERGVKPEEAWDVVQAGAVEPAFVTAAWWDKLPQLSTRGWTRELTVRDA